MENSIKVNQKQANIVIDNIKINVFVYELNVKAIFKVDLYQENGNFITSEYVEILGEDFINWEQDDFVINYILDKLNLTAINGN